MNDLDETELGPDEDGIAHDPPANESGDEPSVDGLDHDDPFILDDPRPDDPQLAGPDDRPNFEPSENADVVAGDPGGELEHWHMQEHQDTCAVASQEFVLESITHHHFSEEALMHEAEANGWYAPGGGTPLEDTGRLLEAHGVPTERAQGETIEGLRDRLYLGQKVIVGVDADEIWTPGEDPMTDDGMDPIPGQDANHAVEVTGIVHIGSDDMVVLNDPGQPDGRGVMIPVSEFEGAWNDSDNFIVAAGPGIDASSHAAGSELRDAVGPGLGYSYSTGETVGGDPVSYSVSEDRNFNERTWGTVEET